MDHEEYLSPHYPPNTDRPDTTILLLLLSGIWENKHYLAKPKMELLPVIDHKAFVSFTPSRIIESQVKEKVGRGFRVAPVYGGGVSAQRNAPEPSSVLRSRPISQSTLTATNSSSPGVCHNLSKDQFDVYSPRWGRGQWSKAVTVTSSAFCQGAGEGSERERERGKGDWYPTHLLHFILSLHHGVCYEKMLKENQSQIDNTMFYSSPEADTRQAKRERTEFWTVWGEKDMASAFLKNIFEERARRQTLTSTPSSLHLCLSPFSSFLKPHMMHYLKKMKKVSSIIFICICIKTKDPWCQCSAQDGRLSDTTSRPLHDP